jgi:hypothetical protein
MMSKDISWSGLWWIDEPYGGLCVLNQVMHQMFGDYAYRGGKLEGIVRCRTFTGTWEEDTPLPNGKGRFRLVISRDGQVIIGHWWYGDRVTPVYPHPSLASTWVMNRKQPSDFKLRWPG